MRDLMIATGWCVPFEDRMDTPRTKEFERTDYFRNVFFPHIENQIKPKLYCIYESLGKYPYLFPKTLDIKIVNIPAFIGYKDVSYRHDNWAAFLIGASYALANHLDLVYIEQDCLVVGLEKALDLARTHEAQICYGFGDDASYFLGWAATSFVYVKFEYLKYFISRIVVAGVLNSSERAGNFEKTWQRLFSEHATYWPFGYDRKRPIDFSQEMFYAQQMTQVELDQFKGILNLGGKDA